MKKSLMIASLKSGSGKTLFTLSLIKHYKKNNKVRAFKTGPDYIDTSLLSMASKNHAINLDLFFVGEKELKKQFTYYSKDYDVNIIESAMGYYNGIHNYEPLCSAYEIATILNSDVVLVVNKDNNNLSQLIREIREYIYKYGNATQIKYIVFNNTNKIEYEYIKNALNRTIKNIQFLGYIEFNKDLVMQSRHLGLKIYDEKTLDDILKKAYKHIKKTVNFNKLDKIIDKKIKKQVKVNSYKKRLKIAITRDEAFCFFYEDNITLLKQKGFDILYFSPLNDKKLPKDIDAIWFCGGYPEMFADKLSKNIYLKNDILDKLSLGIPFIAECGGFMYLHKRLEGIDGKYYEMLGFFNDSCYKTNKLNRFGYISIEAEKNSLLFKKGDILNTHEFHYWDSTSIGSDLKVEKANKSKAWKEGIVSNSFYAGFMHIHLRGNKNILNNLYKGCKNYHEINNKNHHLLDDVYKLSMKKWDSLAKPISGFGDFEDSISKIEQINKKEIKNFKTALCIFCADSKIVDNNISQCDSNVTAIVANNIIDIKSSTAIMASKLKIAIKVIDVGIRDKHLLISDDIYDFNKEQALNPLHNVAVTSYNFRDIYERTFNLVKELKNSGYNLLIAGEMGIGNTTTSTAIAAAYMPLDIDGITGRGAGLNDKKLQNKKRIIKELRKKYANKNHLELLRSIGGNDIIALYSFYLACAYYEIPVILDGVISQLSAYMAYETNTNVIKYLIASHESKEQLSHILLDKLNLKPIINANLCLGEGSGAVLYYSMLKSVLYAYNETIKFDETDIESYKRAK